MKSHLLILNLAGNFGRILMLTCLSFLFSLNAYSQEFRSKDRRIQRDNDTSNIQLNAFVVTGTVKSIKGNEILPLAVVRELGSNNVVQSNDYGHYLIKLDIRTPKKLICSYLGFESDTIAISYKNSVVDFSLKESFTTIKDIVVSASRKDERRFESPVTIESLHQVDLLSNPSMNMYERLINMATVDAITTSANFKTINTRGFNSSYNQRFIQRLDNMDLSMPGFNLSLGALNGPIDLDVVRMELIPGANSALYGPNAISGLMNTLSKNPFLYQGLSVEVKTGVNHVDGIDNTPQPLYDLNLRYAKVLSKKVAAKVTFGYMKIADWHATDYRDVSNYSYTKNLTEYGYQPGPGNPGYNGLNIGGDEVSAIFDTSIKAPVTNQPFLSKGALRVSRTGYREDQLFHYEPYMLKGDFGFYYRPWKDVEVSWQSRFGRGTSNFQTDNRTQVNNYFLQQHKLEAKGKNYVFRSYVSAESLGEAIDISLTSVNLNRAAKADQNWFMQYLLAYSGFYNSIAWLSGKDSITPGNDATARKFADGNNSDLYATLLTLTGNDSATASLILGGSRFEPGTIGFDSVYEIIKNKSFSEDGGRIKSISKNWYSEFVYDFSPYTKAVSLQAGVNYRLYMPNTLGSVFADTLHLIYFNEVGGFVQAGKSFLNEQLKLQGSVRADAFQNFNPRFSPRLSAMYVLGKKKQHNIRASAQIGFRMPALIDMYSHMNVKGALTFGGFLSDAQQLNLVRTTENGSQFVNMYTSASVVEFLYSGDSTRLRKPVIKDIAPEELRTVEIGWRSFMYGKLETDVNIYFNTFQNLISAQQYIGPINRNDTINAAYVKNQQLTQVYRRAANADFPVHSYGLSIALTYYHNRVWAFYGNYNFNQLITSETFIRQNFEKGFNTPNHKFNLGARGTKIFKNFGLTTNFRYVDQFYFSEYERVGLIDAYYSLDLAFNYVVTKQSLLLKLGGTNITNQRYIQGLGSPTVGAMFYFSVIYDSLIK